MIWINTLGDGVVGEAVSRQMIESREVGYNISDPRDFIDDKADGYIIAVPTPASFGGTLNMSILLDVLDDARIDPSKPVLIKSTITVDFAIWLKCHRPNVCFSPEFLRENHAIEDVFAETKMIIGGNGDHVEFWKEIFYPHITDRNNGVIINVDIVEAALIKLAENSMLAMKVTFANELHELSSKLGIDYSNVAGGLALDSRLGKSHWQVPGPDGRYGWGGKCLPKDSIALASTGRKRGVPFSTLEAAIEKNYEYRDINDQDM
jgi:UDPglucose 6-dehydrogenase